MQPTEEIELAEFADREMRLKVLKQAKSAGLPPREYELFALVVNDPRRFLRSNRKLNHREAAEELGVAMGTVKSLWSRTRKTFLVI